MKASDISVRKATLNDASVIADVHAASWKLSYEGMLSPDVLVEGVSRRCSVERWRSSFEDPSSAHKATFLAERDSQLLGFVQIGAAEHDKTTGEIYRIYVIASEWGKGTSQLLMEAALRELSEQGFDDVMLWTPGSPRQRRFYEKSGFTAGISREYVLYDGVTTTVVEMKRSIRMDGQRDPNAGA